MELFRGVNALNIGPEPAVSEAVESNSQDRLGGAAKVVVVVQTTLKELAKPGKNIGIRGGEDVNIWDPAP